MFKFKEENKEANIAKVKQMLESLPQQITALLSMEVGVDFCKTERAMDLVLTRGRIPVCIARSSPTHLISTCCKIQKN